MICESGDLWYEKLENIIWTLTIVIDDNLLEKYTEIKNFLIYSINNTVLYKPIDVWKNIFRRSEWFSQLPSNYFTFSNWIFSLKGPFPELRQLFDQNLTNFRDELKSILIKILLKMMSTATQHKKLTDLYHQKYSLALSVGFETNLSQFVIFQFLHFLISSIE